VGLGTWAIGGGDWKFGWGPQDEREAIDAVIKAVDLGINWVDTAAVYGDGQSETIVGRALKELGSTPRPFVATKCSRVVQPDGNVLGDLSRANIMREVEASLKRLDIDVIDLYQLHWPKPPEDIEEGWGAMAELVQQGKVRHIGVSNFNVEQMQKIQSIHPITSLQPPYSMIVRDIEEDVLDFCAQQGIGVISYSPMYKGLLTGAFSAERIGKLDQGDHRLSDPNFRSPKLERHLALVESLRPIAERNNRTLAELSVAWVLRQPAVTSAIVGARRPEQIASTAPAGDWELGSADIAEIEQILDES
jgi:aryl-alcohol dehydrogenase-like predicted oxidoreductase